MTSLRWERRSDRSELAWCGQACIGYVTLTNAGLYRWQVNGVDLRGIAQRSGNVKTKDTARAAVVRGWRKWLAKAGL